MRKLLFGLLAAGLSVLSCSQFDDSELWAELNVQKERIDELVQRCDEMNSNISALRTVVDAVESGDYVTKVETLVEDTTVKGYKIYFSKNNPITIYHGKDGLGITGKLPLVGAKKDTDGIYYWTLDGEWLLDGEYNKIKAQGEDGTPGQDGSDGTPGQNGSDGVTPQLKIEGDYWYVSYDNGTNWTKLGKAVGEDGASGSGGDSMFRKVEHDADNVYMTLVDGTEFVLAKSPEGKKNYLLGMWAQIDESQLASTFIVFGDLYRKYEEYNEYFIHDKTAWRCSDLNFYQKEVMPYTISGDVIYLDGEEWGEYSIEGDILTVAGVKYMKVNRADAGYYSTLKLKSERSFVYDYHAGNKKIEYEIINPVPGAEIVVSYNVVDDVEDGTIPQYLGCNGDSGGPLVPEEDLPVIDLSESTHDFITGISCVDGILSLSICENNNGKDRRGDIMLSYKVGEHEIAKTLRFGFTQTYSAPTLVIDSDVTSYPASGGSYSVDYTMENPRDGGQLKVSGSPDWITGVTLTDSKISFSLNEYEGLGRSGTIDLSYNYGTTVSAMSFTISQQGGFDLSSVKNDLSWAASANCYIVSEAGLYKFKAVRGNSSEFVGSVASAEVLWESFGTSETPAVSALIGGEVYSDDYIYFSTPDTFSEGNAVIAAKDANGTILWSWHIWLTDQPEDQIYNNSAGTMMDRNLGATSATPGDVKAWGLLYQWGRKDPFLGSSSILSSTRAESTLVTWPSPVSSDSSSGTIAYATAHPTTLIAANVSNYDWYYTGNSSTDNTRWQSSKTIYDPCPPGYRVPDGGSNGVWSTAFGTSSDFDQGAFDSTNEGFNFGSSVSTNKLTSTSTTCWYPAAGFLSVGSDHPLINAGYSGFYWSCSPYDYYACGLGFHGDGGVAPSSSHFRTDGLSVRCARE